MSKPNHLVSIEDFADPESIDGFPNIGAGKTFRAVVETIRKAKQNEAPIIWGLGGHVIKTGVSPWIIKMIKSGYCTHIAMNGAAAIHDIEIALYGSTSEDVCMGLVNGTYGADTGAADLLVTDCTDTVNIQHADQLIAIQPGLADVYRLFSVGCEFIQANMCPCDASTLFARSFQSFIGFRDTVYNIMHNGGVYINCGSAVILPECFLKAMAWVRQQDVANGYDYDHKNGSMPKPDYSFSCINLDMQKQYRTTQQIIERPKLLGAKTYELIGMHEINIPLICREVLRLR